MEINNGFPTMDTSPENHKDNVIAEPAAEKLNFPEV